MTRTLLGDLAAQNFPSDDDDDADHLRRLLSTMAPLDFTDDSLSMHSSISDCERKRYVKFAETAAVHVIERIEDLSQDERSRTWYNKFEYDEIKQKMIPLVRAMMKGEKIEETNDMTFRGLEYRTRQGALRRQHNKVNSITSVLEEQDRQRLNRDLDIENIKRIYEENSFHCSATAQQQGIEDEETVRQYSDDAPQMVPEDDFTVTSSTSDSDEGSLSSSFPFDSNLMGIGNLANKLRRQQQRALPDEVVEREATAHSTNMPQAA